MSDDKMMDHPEDLKGAASRRSRKDEQGRDYVCGCGKRYLSYPALYTHIKTKHEGHQPEGTQKTGVTPAVRRSKPKLDERILKQVQNLVHSSNLSILNYLDQNSHGILPLASRIRKQLLSKQLIDSYQYIMKISSTNSLLDKKSTLETVLVCYLIGVGHYVSEGLFQYYCQFAKQFRNCYYQYGNQIYQFCFKSHDTKDRQFNVHQCRLAPIICDFYLRYYLPVEATALNTHVSCEYLAVMEIIVSDFCQWMYQNRMTIVEVTLKNTSGSIHSRIRRNLIQPKNNIKKENSDNDIDNQENDNDEQAKDQSENDSSQEKGEQQNENVSSGKDMVSGFVQENGGGQQESGIKKVQVNQPINHNHKQQQYNAIA